jgi:hypothetical protein
MSSTTHRTFWSLVVLALVAMLAASGCQADDRAPEVGVGGTAGAGLGGSAGAAGGVGGSGVAGSADSGVPADAGSDCQRGGCSSQLCLEPGDDLASTCEFRPEYACYRSARCERQPGGACGWTPTPELSSCLGSDFRRYLSCGDPVCNDNGSPVGSPPCDAEQPRSRWAPRRAGGDRHSDQRST